MIVRVNVQLNGERKPCEHLALVFDDVITPADFITYRNAATTLVKNVLTNEDTDGSLSDECFFLLQFAEFISSSLDEFLERKGGCHDEG